jgi:hypothetical protein
MLVFLALALQPGITNMSTKPKHHFSWAIQCVNPKFINSGFAPRWRSFFEFKTFCYSARPRLVSDQRELVRLQLPEECVSIPKLSGPSK